MSPEDWAAVLALLRRDAGADLAAIMEALAFNPERMTADLPDIIAEVVADHGAIGAELALVSLLEERASAGITRPINLAPSQADGVDKLRGPVKWATAPLFGPDGKLDLDAWKVKKAADRLGHVVDLAVTQPARDTAYEGAVLDRGRGVRYARIPSGPDTCAFCLLVASRGPVYASRTTAGSQGDAGTKFHPYCDCRIEPIYPGRPLPADYPLREYERRYREAIEHHQKQNNGRSPADLVDAVKAIRSHEKSIREGE